MTGGTENTISGGVFFDVVIQGQNITVVLPDRPQPALAGLPRRSTAFTGRRAELDRVLTALSPAENPTGTVVVTGLPGIGKTEFMIQAAHQVVRKEGWFPGGVLFADLHGYDEQGAVSPKRALNSLLRALGVAPDRIPPGTDDRARMYRSALHALASAGHRLLVVLDDVLPSDKLHLLLPDAGDAGTLISSRHSLTELNALAVTLPQLSPEDGRRLLRDSLLAVLPDDSRAEAEPDEMDRLATLCGGLPLALRILVSLLADIPSRTLSRFRQDLGKAHSRLSVLSRENRAVAAAFELSYRRLTEEQAALFRMLALHPGPDFSTEATARLCGQTEEEIERLLSDLARRHLVQHEPYDRWHQHSLVRAYSQERLRASDDRWGEGLLRLFAYFHELATSACAEVFSLPLEATEHPAFTDQAKALAWLETERESLIAAILWAHKAADDFICVALAVPTSRFLAEMHYLEDASGVLTAGILSSQRDGDSHREAAFLSALGIVLRSMHKLRRSARVHRRAIEICRKLGERNSLAGALNNLGLTLHDQRKFEKAVTVHTEAARIHKRSGDQLGVARALSNVGETLYEMELTEEASRALRKAKRIFRKHGDLRGYAQTLGTIAKMTRDDGKVARALKLHDRALALADGRFTPHERAIELSNLAGTLTVAKDYEAALTAHQEALDVFRQLGDRHGEAMSLGNMASIRQQEGKWHKAGRLHTLALEGFFESKDFHHLAVELTSLATTLLRQGHNMEALENLELSADLYHQIGDTERAARTLAQIIQVRNRVGGGVLPRKLDTSAPR